MYNIRIFALLTLSIAPLWPLGENRVDFLGSHVGFQRVLVGGPKVGTRNHERDERDGQARYWRKRI